MSERCRSRSPARGTGDSDGGRCPVCGQIPSSQKDLQVAKAECEDLGKTLQLVRAYLQDAKKMEICRGTLLEFQKETIWKAAETLQGVTEKLGQNPYLMPMWEAMKRQVEWGPKSVLSCMQQAHCGCFFQAFVWLWL